MIVKFQPDKNPIKHFDNMLKILKFNPIYALLKDFKPVFAGGYATALLLSQRDKTGLILDYSKYSDIDVYVPDTEQVNKFLEEKIASRIVVKEISTIWATTYRYINNDLNIKFQIINNKTDNFDPSSILSTYDFVHCCIAIDTEDNLWIHKDLIKNHLESILAFYNPWMIEDTSELLNISTTLYRIHKYCDRWELEPSEQMITKLYNVFLEVGKIPIHRNPENTDQENGLIEFLTSGGRQRQRTRYVDAWQVVYDFITSTSYLTDEQKNTFIDRVPSPDTDIIQPLETPAL